ncbi:MAG: tRNA uridine-5-carboxymethylaminomethyl(34) synthesis GTPase MnmE [Rhodobacteraceae bacterium]|nr:tRNA uridine-5-carboxymethylaminomethyl(34) synthesis GTPase MnmE [Paracoccaceae bacterium]
MPDGAGNETVFALASAEGRAGVAVVRVSGAKAFDAVETLCGAVPAPRTTSLRILCDADGSIIDEALVLTFAAGASFTGEAVAEFHCHGSPAVIRRLLGRLGDMPGLCMAAPGEFTRRAFENGNLDLTRVEGLGDLIDAETEAQRKQAMAIYDGQLSKALESVRGHLLRGAALCEAGIDFADEEVPEDVDGPTRDALEAVSGEIETILRGHEQARLITNGLEVAIIGAPNVGKSTLLNAIAGDDIAIVTEVAGTTRDVIECRVNLGGRLVTFLDTAGLRDTDDIVEREGIRRAEIRAQRADMRLFLSMVPEEDHPLLQAGDIKVLTKSDVSGSPDGISAKTGAGVAELLEEIEKSVALRTKGAGLVSSERQAYLLKQAASHTDSALATLVTGVGSELVAHHIRDALRSVEEIVGRVGVEEVLGEIFSSFCIGK